jgi:hypothetical protein
MLFKFIQVKYSVVIINEKYKQQKFQIISNQL